MNDAAHPDTQQRPVIVVTGANGGVGFGICQRILVQLSTPTPPDTLPYHAALAEKRAAEAARATRSHSGSTRVSAITAEQPLPSPFAAPHGCTLVLACRNAIKAHRARAELQAMLTTLHDLPDDAPTPTDPPPPSPVERARLGRTDEDEDPAKLAQAAEASIRRRKARREDVVGGGGVVGGGAGGQGGETERGGEGDGGEDGFEESERERERHLERDNDEDTIRNLPLPQREARARGMYRRRFCRGSRIEFVALDLGSMASALKCAKDVTERHGYVTHLILNAGSGAWEGINWLHATWMMTTSLRAAVTYPAFKKQRSGDIGKDGFGWVWQANIGAHYVLTRALLPALRATPYSTPSRIVWTGSIEAMQKFYHPEDFQCRDADVSPKAYESTKYQCELIALGLEEALSRTCLATQPSTPAAVDDDIAKMSLSGPRTGRLEPKSFISHPGVVASSIFAEFLNVFLAFAMKAAFYVASVLALKARWLFSPHHPVEAYKGAVAAVHVALAPLPNLDPYRLYGARCDWWGREYVDAGRLDGWFAKKRSGGSAIHSARSSGNSDGAGSVDGETVLDLARDLLHKCEEVARQVWEEAREGSLPPFGELQPLLGDEDRAVRLLPGHQEVHRRHSRKDSETSSWDKVNDAC